jgi:hypothetical protein
LPPRERLSTRREVIATISIEPSGIQPSPDGASSISNSTRTSPAGDTDLTALAKKSLNQSRPSRQRGPSPKYSPSQRTHAIRLISLSLRSLLHWTMTPSPQGHSPKIRSSSNRWKTSAARGRFHRLPPRRAWQFFSLLSAKSDRGTPERVKEIVNSS